MSFLPEALIELKKRLLNRVFNWWESYFLTPMSPLSLALTRMVMFGLLFWKSLSHRWVFIGDWPPEFLQRIAITELPYVTRPILGCLTLILAMFSCLGMLGLFTRWAAAICFIILFLFNGVDGGVYDSGWLLFSFLLLITCSNSEDALSIKRFWFRKSTRDLNSLSSWEYRWPLRVMQLTFILSYTTSGIYKLLLSGVNWLSPDILQGWYLFHLRTDTYYYHLGYLLLEYPVLATLAAVGTLTLEVGILLVLVNERLKWLFIPGLFLMHLMIGLTLNIWFKEYFFLLMVFFDWQHIATWLQRRFKKQKEPTELVELNLSLGG